MHVCCDSLPLNFVTAAPQTTLAAGPGVVSTPSHNCCKNLKGICPKGGAEVLLSTPQ